jgi:Mechanosensitive ion channel
VSIRVFVCCWLLFRIRDRSIEPVRGWSVPKRSSNDWCIPHICGACFIPDESIVTVGFYAVLSLVVMAILGVDIQTVIIGLASIVVSFAFMIGPASSKALEVCTVPNSTIQCQSLQFDLTSPYVATILQGILFVLLRKPYDIGDRVNVGDPASPSHAFGGDSNWIVEKVDLYTTTARLGVTRELATFSNGSLANMRIVNLNRSDKPNVTLNLKISVDSSLEHRESFKRQITAFIKERPRQWSKVVDFRCTGMENDLGYIEYALVLQHRERWQNVGAILASRGEVYNHAVELLKELDMKYTAPYVPVDIQHIGYAQRPTPTINIHDELKKNK